VIRIRLTDDEAKFLEEAFRQASDRTLLDRLQIVRLAQRSRKHKDIAADLGITPSTAQRWLNAYLAGLVHRMAKGNAPAIPAEIAEEVRRWVIDVPSALGLHRANWTHAELADNLRKSRSITAGRSAMQRLAQGCPARSGGGTWDFEAR
jgi:transposase